MKNAVKDVNEIGKYHYFAMCIDADEVEVNFRIMEVKTFMENNEIALNPNTNFILIVQNRCIETWFLGNRIVVQKESNRRRFKRICQIL